MLWKRAYFYKLSLVSLQEVYFFTLKKTAKKHNITIILFLSPLMLSEQTIWVVTDIPGIYLLQ